MAAIPKKRCGCGRLHLWYERRTVTRHGVQVKTDPTWTKDFGIWWLTPCLIKTLKRKLR